MAGEHGGVEAGEPRPRLDDLGHCAGREACSHAPVAIHRPEHRARCDPRCRDPGLVGLDRAGPGSAPDRDHLSLTFLVALGAADRDPQAQGLDPDVLDLQGNQLGASERTGEAHQEQGAIANVDQPIPAGLQDPPQQRRREGLSVALGDTLLAAQAPQHVADRRVAVSSPCPAMRCAVAIVDSRRVRVATASVSAWAAR